MVENQSHDEINLLTKAFNQMLNRLEFSFNTQKEFTSNASHELYTPLTRISLQLENLMNAGNHPPETEQYLKNINNDVHQMADLINSLLLLAKLNQDEIGKKLETLRVDDLVFDAYSQMQRNFPDFTMHFELEDNEAVDNAFEIHGFKSLLQIVIVNLLKNAYLYSEDKKATVLIQQPDASTRLLRLQIQGKH